MASPFVLCIVLMLVFTDRINADDESDLADDINTYGINYYQKERDPNENTLLSGYGSAIIKTMLLVGARETTETNLRSQLNLDPTGLSTEQIETAYNRILTKQRNHNPAYTLDVADVLYVQNGINVLSDYKSDLANNFLADARNVDFGSASSTSEINRWVQQVTRRPNRVAGLFRGFDSSDKVISLMNILSFKGRLKIPFNIRQLRRRPFTTETGRTLLGLTVARINMYNYTNSQALNAEVLELPYRGDEVSMYIVLPRTSSGLENLESQFTLDDLKAAMGELTMSKVAVTIPFISDYNQLGTLTYLALTQEDNIEDDLSGINGQQNLYESEDDQNDFFSYGLDTLRITRNSIGRADVNFNANHPFMYFLLHKPTNIILFMGRLVRPLANGIL